MLDTSKIYTSKNYGKFKVIRYINSRNVTVQFLDTLYKVTTRVDHIVNGNVKDRLALTVCGVGFIGEGKHKSSINNSLTIEYKRWSSMMHRCYDLNRHIKWPTYKDVTVCDDWHNFQNFAKWFHSNYIKGLHLDKDIKIGGNKIYSPNACSFVSTGENTEKAHAKNYKFISPQGEEVFIYNLSYFCKKNKLNHGNMSSVHSGRKAHHKQWRKA